MMRMSKDAMTIATGVVRAGVDVCLMRVSVAALAVTEDAGMDTRMSSN